MSNEKNIGQVHLKCIWCISYTGAGKDSGKLPGVTKLAEIQIECDAHLLELGIR